MAPDGEKYISKSDRHLNHRNYDIERWSVDDAGMGGYIKLNFDGNENQLNIEYTLDKTEDRITISYRHLQEFIEDLIDIKKVIDKTKQANEI